MVQNSTRGLLLGLDFMVLIFSIVFLSTKTAIMIAEEASKILNLGKPCGCRMRAGRCENGFTETLPLGIKESSSIHY